MNALPGRNDPCWCGSGKKYKRCHMDSDNAGASSPDGTGGGGDALDVLQRAGIASATKPAAALRALIQPAQPKQQPRPKKAPILNEQERDGMRAAGRFNALLMDQVRAIVRPGVSTSEIDQLVYTFTRDHGHRPATLGYRGASGHPYPNSCCISVNEIVCHGIPGRYRLREGDIANVDLTTIVDGWHGDQSETFMVGDVSDAARELVQCTHDSLWVGIHAIRPFGVIDDIGRAIKTYAEALGYSVVDEYQGHGLGRAFHQEPGVPHVPTGDEKGNFVVKPGMCFTIEPMINQGVKETKLDKRDKWTVRTKDRKLSAQFEHSILMTETGPEVLTLTQNGPHEGHKF